jgi:transcriptional regulator with XRE-family HTH domain
MSTGHPPRSRTVIDGSVLAGQRQRLNLTQTMLATEVGCTASYINHLENGRRATPHLRMIDALADALGVDGQELLTTQEIRVA